MASTAGENQRTPRVFISYSHDSAEYCNRVLELATRLGADGLNAQLDQFENSAPPGWPLWCGRQITDSNYVAIIGNRLYRDRFLGWKLQQGRGVMGSQSHQNILYDGLGGLFQSSTLRRRHIPKTSRLHGISFLKQAG